MFARVTQLAGQAATDPMAGNSAQGEFSTTNFFLATRSTSASTGTTVSFAQTTHFNQFDLMPLLYHTGVCDSSMNILFVVVILGNDSGGGGGSARDLFLGRESSRARSIAGQTALPRRSCSFSLKCKASSARYSSDVVGIGSSDGNDCNALVDWGLTFDSSTGVIDWRDVYDPDPDD